MEKPPHPGRAVKDALDALDLPVADAAHGLGVSRYQLHRVIAGTSAISPEMAVRLQKGLGTPAGEWLAAQAAYDAAKALELAADIQVERLKARSTAGTQARQGALF